MKRANKATGILFVTQGNRDHASSRIRCLQYFPLLHRSGFRCFWLPRIPVKRNNIVYQYLVFPVLKRINRLRIILGILILPYQFLFIQRIFLPEWVMKAAGKRKKKIIFDFDDAIYLSDSDKKAGKKTRRMIELSGRIIVSSPVLHEYSSAIHPGVVMITSPVSVAPVLPSTGNSATVVIGWIGSEWTCKYLTLLSGVFVELQKKYKADFLFIGSKPDILPEIHPEIIPWSQEGEPVWLSRMDIGIMPLTDTGFEKGKGGYKLLQYMASGIPVVASPVGINTLIVQEGVNGYLCKNPEEWYQALEKLLLDEPLRKKTGEAGYRLVREKYSLQVCFDQMLNVLNKL